jgi:hypothetical protein
MAGLHLRYLRDAKDSGIAFRQFLESIGVGNPADEMDGRAGAVQRIEIPHMPVTGT